MSRTELVEMEKNGCRRLTGMRYPPLDRPPRSVEFKMSLAGFRALELPLRAVATPSQAEGPVVSRCDFTPPPLRGQRRISTGFPILRSVTTQRHLRWHDL